jgi:hypothetical protein
MFSLRNTVRAYLSVPLSCLKQWRTPKTWGEKIAIVINWKIQLSHGKNCICIQLLPWFCPIVKFDMLHALCTSLRTNSETFKKYPCLSFNNIPAVQVLYIIHLIQAHWFSFKWRLYFVPVLVISEILNALMRWVAISRFILSNKMYWWVLPKTSASQHKLLERGRNSPNSNVNVNYNAYLYMASIKISLGVI